MMLLTKSFRIITKLLTMVTAMVAILSSCSIPSERIWSEAAYIQSPWRPEDKVIFTPDSAILSQSPLNRLIIFSRYLTDTNISSLPILLEIDSPQIELSDTITLQLFDKTGHPTGIGSWKLRTITDTINLPDRLSPGAEISLSPLPTDPLPQGIINIGITLIPNN